jgi:hypothetical protein
MAVDTIWPTSPWQRYALATRRTRPNANWSPWFTVNAVVELRGPFDRAVFAAALDELLRRHELLRTRLGDNGREPVQVVAPQVAGTVELLDADDITAHAPVSADALSPLVVRLARRGPRDHVLSLHIHHLLGDPATLWTILAELASLYSAALGGDSPPPPSAQYGEYSQYEATQTGGALDAATRRWWASAVGEGRFGTVRSGSPGTPFAFREQVMTADEFAAAQRLSGAHRGTTFVTLLAALSCAMRPHVTDGDLMFLTIFGKRDRPEWQRMLGPCIVASYLPVPSPPEQLTAPYSHAVRDAVLACYRHCRLDANDVSTMNPFFDDPTTIVPFFEYVPHSRPTDVRFGPAIAHVVDAAGPKDLGKARFLGLRTRTNSEGALVAHLSANGEGWTEPVTRGLWRDAAEKIRTAQPVPQR